MRGKKELILNTAAKLFFKNGITKTSMDDIANEAKIGKGTIYHYYDSKEELFVEVTEKEVAFLRGALVEAVGRASGPEDRLRAYIIARCEMVSKIAGLFRLFKEEYMQYYSYIRKVQEKFLSFEKDILVSNLKEASDKGIFAVNDTDFTAFVIGRAIHAMEYYFGAEVKSGEMHDKAAQLADVFISGLKKREGAAVYRA